LSISVAPVLHVPDEPTTLAESWLAHVVDGRDLDDVLTDGDGSVAAWFWSRWRSLASTGLSEAAFARIVLDYRRELWLWLAGERTWVQCCSGLIGRINRRVAGGDAGTGA
jgi:hypothetical protein